ncbi:hypothetical protein V8C44DRAFT_256071 [Trichoderma aethiopicum]
MWLVKLKVKYHGDSNLMSRIHPEQPAYGHLDQACFPGIAQVPQSSQVGPKCKWKTLRFTSPELRITSGQPNHCNEIATCTSGLIAILASLCEAFSTGYTWEVQSRILGCPNRFGSDVGFTLSSLNAGYGKVSHLHFCNTPEGWELSLLPKFDHFPIIIERRWRDSGSPWRHNDQKGSSFWSWFSFILLSLVGLFLDVCPFSCCVSCAWPTVSTTWYIVIMSC